MSQLKKGIRIEREHSKTIAFITKHLKTHKKLPPRRAIYTHIAKDHLKEDKKYYTKLEKAKL